MSNNKRQQVAEEKLISPVTSVVPVIWMVMQYLVTSGVHHNWDLSWGRFLRPTAQKLADCHQIIEDLAQNMLKGFSEPQIYSKCVSKSNSGL